MVCMIYVDKSNLNIYQHSIRYSLKIWFINKEQDFLNI